MTSPKTKLTPAGAAAHNMFSNQWRDSSDPIVRISKFDWNAIAQAAIDAAKPSEALEPSAEREHCEQALNALWLGRTSQDDINGFYAHVFVLERERAAVRAECQVEIERLRAENKDLIEHLKMAEKCGVEEGLFDVEDCGWYTGEENT